MKTFLTSALILILIVSIGVVLILKIRSWWQADSDGHNDWTNTLAEYRGLRDRGVLSDEEYRKIRTLVEPHMQSVPMEHSREEIPNDNAEASDSDLSSEDKE
jgi:hypothetical protein|tara:strand:+ start:40 stop:345 length:306 start_codon:yes stop_codon:yes gene_type:complete